MALPRSADAALRQLTATVPALSFEDELDASLENRDGGILSFSLARFTLGLARLEGGVVGLLVDAPVTAALVSAMVMVQGREWGWRTGNRPGLLPSGAAADPTSALLLAPLLHSSTAGLLSSVAALLPLSMRREAQHGAGRYMPRYATELCATAVVAQGLSVALAVAVGKLSFGGEGKATLASALASSGLAAAAAGAGAGGAAEPPLCGASALVAALYTADSVEQEAALGGSGSRRPPLMALQPWSMLLVDLVIDHALRLLVGVSGAGGSGAGAVGMLSDWTSTRSLVTGAGGIWAGVLSSIFFGRHRGGAGDGHDSLDDACRLLVLHGAASAAVAGAVLAAQALGAGKGAEVLDSRLASFFQGVRA